MFDGSRSMFSTDVERITSSISTPRSMSRL